jgi:hypothetical protein
MYNEALKKMPTQQNASTNYTNTIKPPSDNSKTKTATPSSLEQNSNTNI